MISHLTKWDGEEALFEGAGRTLCGQTISQGDVSAPEAGSVVFEIEIQDGFTASFELCVACLSDADLKVVPDVKTVVF